MNKINIEFKKNSKGTFDFEVNQNGLILFKKEYQAAEKTESGLTQAQVFSGYSHYLQDLVNKSLAKNPDFKWDTFDDFKKFAGAKTQHMFWAVKDKFIDYPKAN